MNANEPIDWNRTGTIFNIQRYSLHDGPGIRTIVFFKGCALRCKWCSNPESQISDPQILFIKSRCIGCRACEKACPSGAIVMEENRRILEDKCIHCGNCAKACMAEALELKGQKVTVREVYEQLKKDEVYYAYSEGGITLSGGEALLQPEFAVELFKACHQSGWNTAVETALFVSEDAIRTVLPYTDLFLADFKVFDSEAHRTYTGQSNDTIKQNIKYISDNGGKIILRIPLIPGVNDSESNLRSTALFAKELGTIEEIDLLPYHRLGVNKYDQLGRDYLLPELRQPSGASMRNIADILKEYGFRVRIGG